MGLSMRASCRYGAIHLRRPLSPETTFRVGLRVFIVVSIGFGGLRGPQRGSRTGWGGVEIREEVIRSDGRPNFLGDITKGREIVGEACLRLALKSRWLWTGRSIKWA